MQICEAFFLLVKLAIKDGADKPPSAQFWERNRVVIEELREHVKAAALRPSNLPTGD